MKPFSRKVRQSTRNYLNRNLVLWAFLKMVLEQSWSQKRMLWAFEKVIFQSFANIWARKFEPSSAKVGECIKDCLNQNLAIGSFLENSFEATLSSKRMLCVFRKGIFQIFAIIWVTKFKPFSGKLRQGVQSCLNQNLVVGIF